MLKMDAQKLVMDSELLACLKVFDSSKKEQTIGDEVNPIFEMLKNRGLIQSSTINNHTISDMNRSKGVDHYLTGKGTSEYSRLLEDENSRLLRQCRERTQRL